MAFFREGWELGAMGIFLTFVIIGGGGCGGGEVWWGAINLFQATLRSLSH